MTEIWINLLVPFFHHGESGANFKYPGMSRDSIWLFGHVECLNPSINDEMGHCSRIRKNVTDREQTDGESSYRGHSNCRWIVRLSGPILQNAILG